MESNMAVVGERAAALALAAMGLRAEPIDAPHQAARAIERLAREGCAIILVTPSAAEAAHEVIARFSAAPTPAIVELPGMAMWRAETGA